MNAPQVIGCSWIPEREFMGSGRVEGVRLDQGKLDLGIVRDTTANMTVHFQVFASTFADVARTAAEAGDRMKLAREAFGKAQGIRGSDGSG